MTFVFDEEMNTDAASEAPATEGEATTEEAPAATEGEASAE